MARLFSLTALFIAVIYSAALGETPNQNYFDNQEPAQSDKRLVEKFHLSLVPDAMRKGSMDTALRDLDFVLRYFPNHPKALSLLGLVAKLKKKPSLPVAYYEKALKLYPQYALTHAQYGMYLIDIGNRKVGIAKLKKAVKMDPKLTQVHVWLAQAYYKSGNLGLARQAAKQARVLGYKGKIQ